MGKQWKQWQALFSWAPKSLGNGDCNHQIKSRLLLGRKAMTNLGSMLKSRDITLLTKVHYNQSYGFSSSHIWMWELDHKAERQRIDAFKLWLEKTLESPLDCKEIKPVHPKGNQPWIFIGRTDAEAETPIFWPPDTKNWLTGKDPDAEKDWRQEEKGTTGWGGWMASLTLWTWVWASSGSWWRTGKPGMLRSMGLQRVRHDWVTALNWTIIDGVLLGYLSLFTC